MIGQSFQMKPLASRRQVLLTAAAAIAMPSVAVSKELTLNVWKTSTCGCCAKWVDHMQGSGFFVKVHEVTQNDLDAIKDRFGVPEQIRSCHTGKIDGYIVEGHVPSSDVKLLLSFKPPALGLAVPGMPIGSPGMEMTGHSDSYSTLIFDGAQNIQVFSQHGA